MKLLWWVAEPPIRFLFGLIPEAPENGALTIPWPAWMPSWVFAYSVVAVLAAGAAFGAIRFLRWIYGLVPVLQ